MRSYSLVSLSSEHVPFAQLRKEALSVHSIWALFHKEIIVLFKSVLLLFCDAFENQFNKEIIVILPGF